PGTGSLYPAAAGTPGDDVAHHARQARPVKAAEKSLVGRLVPITGLPATLIPKGRLQLGSHLRAHVQALVHPLQILALALLKGPVAPRAGKEREHRRADDTHK